MASIKALAYNDQRLDGSIQQALQTENHLEEQFQRLRKISVNGVDDQIKNLKLKFDKEIYSMEEQLHHLRQKNKKFKRKGVESNFELFKNLPNTTQNEFLTRIEQKLRDYEADQN